MHLDTVRFLSEGEEARERRHVERIAFSSFRTGPMEIKEPTANLFLPLSIPFLLPSLQFPPLNPASKLLFFFQAGGGGCFFKIWQVAFGQSYGWAPMGSKRLIPTLVLFLV